MRAVPALYVARPSRRRTAAMTAGSEYPQSKKGGDEKVASTDQPIFALQIIPSMAALLPPSFISFPWGLLRRSLRRADFSERIRRRRPTFRSFTRRGRRRDGRRDERTAISESVHYCYCFARAPRRRGGAVPLADAGQGREKAAAAARPFARSE